VCLVGLSVCFCDRGRRLAAVWWSVWSVFGRMREKQLPVPCRGDDFRSRECKRGFKPDVRPSLKVMV